MKRGRQGPGDFSPAAGAVTAVLKRATPYLPLILLAASLFLSLHIITNSFANQKNKIDYAELNHIKYGLFSVDEWKRQITVILAAEIRDLYLSKKNERDLRGHIEILLNTLIDKLDSNIRQGNSDSVDGWVKQLFINIFLSIEDIKKGIPEYSDAIIRELTKAETRGQIRALLGRQVGQYLNQTHATQNMSHVRRVLLRIDSPDIENARVRLNGMIAGKNALLLDEAVLLILLSVLLFALSWFSRRPLASPRYLLLVLSLVMLLVVGVATPMIDLEAKISQMHFVLLGHPVHFENQVLYFQSKSILDVFWIMITHRSILMKGVGILLVLFSIVFPLLKIVSSLGYYYDYRHARSNPVVRFFVLHSGKWSMADVMVVAIFMAFIGFNGIISSQFDHLGSISRELVIITTNGTFLQPGFYLFLAYVLLALFLSGLLTGESPAERKNPGSRAGRRRSSADG
jgi:hypothetical protein